MYRRGSSMCRHQHQCTLGSPPEKSSSFNSISYSLLQEDEGLQAHSQHILSYQRYLRFDSPIHIVKVPAYLHFFRRNRIWKCNSKRVTRFSFQLRTVTCFSNFLQRFREGRQVPRRRRKLSDETRQRRPNTQESSPVANSICCPRPYRK